MDIDAICAGESSLSQSAPSSRSKDDVMKLLLLKHELKFTWKSSFQALVHYWMRARFMLDQIQTRAEKKVVHIERCIKRTYNTIKLVHLYDHCYTKRGFYAIELKYNVHFRVECDIVLE